MTPAAEKGFIEFVVLQRSQSTSDDDEFDVSAGELCQQLFVRCAHRWPAAGAKTLQ
jgi:hypothetical protein